jgi:hypothetical protein
MAVFGLASARVATSQDRVGLVWFAFGAILGPIALVLLRAAPPARCRSCLTPTRGWLTVCAWCHADVRVIPLETTALVAKMTKSPNERDRPMVRDHAWPIVEAAIENARPTPALPPVSISKPGPVQASRPSGLDLPPIGRLTRPAQDRSPTPFEGQGTTARAPSAATERKADETGVRATATYITGSTALEPGHRYIISVDGARLRLLGPVNVDPSVVALELDMADMDATSMAGRLLISQHGGRSGSVLAFMSVAGTTPDGLAAAIVEAGRTAAQA